MSFKWNDMQQNSGEEHNMANVDCLSMLHTCSLFTHVVSLLFDPQNLLMTQFAST